MWCRDKDHGAQSGVKCVCHSLDVSLLTLSKAKSSQLFFHRHNSMSDESCISHPDELVACVLRMEGVDRLDIELSMIYDSTMCPYSLLSSNIWP